jgi:hypothetical protein
VLLPWEKFHSLINAWSFVPYTFWTLMFFHLNFRIWSLVIFLHLIIQFIKLMCPSKSCFCQLSVLETSVQLLYPSHCDVQTTVLNSDIWNKMYFVCFIFISTFKFYIKYMHIKYYVQFLKLSAFVLLEERLSELSKLSQPGHCIGFS